ncbi:MAG: YceI family protein [Saprospiraceae bacterium]|nr:YceI family protein [Saprospiraceae bacterium]
MKQIFFVLFITSAFLISCKNKSESVQVNEAQTVAEASGKSFMVSSATSKVLWFANSPGGGHNGTFPVADGSLTVDNGVITSGKFTLDLTKLTVDDLSGEDKSNLESHLKGTGGKGQEDFFNTKKFPTSTFEITKVTGLANDKEGNALVYGNLTILTVTKEVSFKANINILENNVTVTTPIFQINRTDWGLKYQSKNFGALKDEFINDEVKLQINLNAGIAQK